MTNFTRAEIDKILELRGLDPETQGDHAFLEFRFRITPELLRSVMDSVILLPNGTRARIVSIFIDKDGLAEPVFETIEMPHED